MLNSDQRRIFDTITNHLSHQFQHENKTCTCDKEIKPLHMFFSGVGGTGKSFLIETIQMKVMEIWKDKESLTCAVAAPTGLAAFNVGGVTIHRLLQLPVEHDNASTYWSLSKEAGKILRNTLKHIKLLIVDEVSMVSNLMLAFIHLRMDDLFGGSDWFGSRNVVFVGDLLQLPPVNGGHVFDTITEKALQNKLGCIGSINIWQDTIIYDELTINERQKKDKAYSDFLNQIRCGLCSEEIETALRSRLISCSTADKFQQLLNEGKSPVCLLPTRNACQEINNEMLCSLGDNVITFEATDSIDSTKSKQQWNSKVCKELDRLNADCNLTAGLEVKLRLAVGARVMLRRNLSTEEGLVNGSLGTVISLTTSSALVKFDHIKEPYLVNKVKSNFQVLKKLYVTREQLPLILAYAVTIHKCQGLSLDCAIVDLSDRIFSPGMAYVALSRVRTLDGVHLTAFNPKSIMVSSDCLREINRLRSTFRSDMDLYDIPSNSESRKRKWTACFDDNNSSSTTKFSQTQ